MKKEEEDKGVWRIAGLSRMVTNPVFTGD